MTGTVPKLYKITKVVPIFKSGDSSEPNNYRPISLISNFAKILEKIVQKRLVNFLNDNDILSTNQFGFRKRNSTLHPLTLLLNKVSDALNKKKTLVNYLL